MPTSAPHHPPPFSVEIAGTQSGRRVDINEWRKLRRAWGGLSVAYWVSEAAKLAAALDHLKPFPTGEWMAAPAETGHSLTIDPYSSNAPITITDGRRVARVHANRGNPSAIGAWRLGPQRSGPEYNSFSLSGILANPQREHL